MRAVPPPPYRDFYYPLNVFMHILTREEGGVAYLHYGLFEREDEAIGVAQERSTKLLLDRLPPPPARLLEVGIGLATTLGRLVEMGYDAEGITPDEKQIAMVRERFGDALRVYCAPFESFAGDGGYDAILFQESTQYIDSDALFARAAALAPLVIVLDEFAMQPLDTPGALRTHASFVEAARRHGFEVEEDLDLSKMAPPTVRYFTRRLPAWRTRLVEDLGITDAQVDELIASGENYVRRYEEGVYAYRLLRLAKTQSRHMKSAGASSRP
jgi:hypothetical protein